MEDRQTPNESKKKGQNSSFRLMGDIPGDTGATQHQFLRARGTHSYTNIFMYLVYILPKTANKLVPVTAGPHDRIGGTSCVYTTYPYGVRSILCDCKSPPGLPL